MADIADEAGVSRQTVYRVCADKTAVFRSVAERLHASIAGELQTIATEPASLGDTLSRLAVAKLRQHIEIASTSPHGRELLDMNQRIAGDLARAADAEFQQLLAGVLTGAIADHWTVTDATALVVTVIAGWQQRILFDNVEVDGWVHDVTATLTIIAAGLDPSTELT